MMITNRKIYLILVLPVVAATLAACTQHTFSRGRNLEDIMNELNQKSSKQLLPFEEAIGVFNSSDLNNVNKFYKTINYQEWLLLTAQLFTSKGNHLEPLQVFEIVKRAGEVLDQFDANEKGKHETYLRRIRLLINVGEVLSKKCNLEAFELIAKINSASLTPQFRNCIAYFNQEQYLHCKDELVKNLNNDVKWVFAPARNNTKQLVDELMEKPKGNISYKYISSEDLETGLFGYVKDHQSFKGDNLALMLNQKKGGKKLFKNEFAKSVINSCLYFTQALETSYRIFSTFRYRSFAEEDLDKEILSWLIGARACTDILANEKSLEDKTYNMLKAENPTLVKSSKCFSFGCFS